MFKMTSKNDHSHKRQQCKAGALWVRDNKYTNTSQTTKHANEHSTFKTLRHRQSMLCTEEKNWYK